MEKELQNSLIVISWNYRIKKALPVYGKALRGG